MESNETTQINASDAKEYITGKFRAEGDFDGFGFTRIIEMSSSAMGIYILYFINL